MATGNEHPDLVDFVPSSPAWHDAPTYWLTRAFILRLLALVYLVAFATAIVQGPALIGEHGLTPASLYLARLAEHFGSRWSGFLQVPSLFWIDASDATILASAWLGVALAAAALVGYANAISMAILWMIQLSFVGIGQDWYAFGWEIQLLETGFLAIFLCPLLDPRPSSPLPPPILVIWMYRWLIARIMLGAGLIKLRGDPCWRELSCLDYHFETQPIPNPLSPWFDALPHWVLAGGVLFTFVAELVAPWLLLVPRRAARHLAGLVMLALQLVLIASGNLSFLNWLTIVPTLACFDDGALRRVVPHRLARRFEELAASHPSAPRGQRLTVIALAVVVALLSIDPVANLLAEHQIMNTSFDRLHLVNTYGAFGSVGRERYELVFEGTSDAELTPNSRWREYELPCKPTDPDRRPCIVTPYHLRLDWLLWFAAMTEHPGRYPWTLHLVWKLLHDDPTVLRLIATNPFPDVPPRWIRIERYRYWFAPLGERPYWRRERVGSWLPPVSIETRALRDYLMAHGWEVRDPPPRRDPQRGEDTSAGSG